VIFLPEFQGIGKGEAQKRALNKGFFEFFSMNPKIAKKIVVFQNK